MSIVGRPKHLTTKMKQRIGEELAKSLVTNGHIDEVDADDAAKDIARYGRQHMDGYELAKELDRGASWDCDLEMAQELDAFSSLAERELKYAAKIWAQETNLTPPYPDGTRVSARWGIETIKGVIEKVYDHDVGKYCIKRDGETGTARALINFEDVTPLDANDPQVRLEQAIDGPADEDRSQDVHGTRFDARDEILAE